MGRQDEAERLLRIAIALGGDTLGPAHKDMCNFAKNLTIVLKKRGMFEEAELMMIQVIGDRIEQLGGLHPDIFTSANNLTMVLCNREHYYDAQMLLRSALAGSERGERHGREHP